jgi:hypothetical protein
MYRIAGVLSCAGLMWGCAGENDGESGPRAEPDNAIVEAGDVPTAEAFFSTLYQGFCSEFVGCRVYETQDTCLSSVGVALSSLEWSVTRGTVRFQPEGAKACLDDFLLSAQCETSERRAAPETSDVACKDAFIGTVALGERCVSSRDCAAGSCEIDADQCVNTCCAGVCGAPRAEGLVVGASCNIDSEQCGRGKYCTAASVCAAYRNFGESCSSEQCFSPMVCEAAGNEMPTCRFSQRPRRGEICAGECDSTDDYCSVEPRMCVARKEPGQACANDDECVGYASCVEGVCLRVLGMACDETVNPCRSYRCVGGTCVEREPYRCE